MGVLDRVVAILDAVEAGNARSQADVVRATGFSRSTTHRLLQAMDAHGFSTTPEHAATTSDRGSSGWRPPLQEPSLRDMAHPALERLADDG